MSDQDTDSALIGAAMRLAGESGWPRVGVVTAARAADVPLDAARARFPNKAMILLRFGSLMDQAALAEAAADGPVKDRLFDLLMSRFDAMQPHRAGVVSVMRALPFDPLLALALAHQTQRSMRWMLQAAGATVDGPRGELQVKGLVAVWLWTLRAWERDTSEDMSGTMAALDAALLRAERLAGWLGIGAAAPVAEEADADFAEGGDASVGDAEGV
jgi:ubiquinone biosynthesis protein COQ9